jgi:hypothetical protein
MRRVPTGVFCLLLILSFVQPRLEGDSVSKPNSTNAGPSLVLIIRHAEKPEDQNDPNLSPRGYQRAGALISYANGVAAWKDLPEKALPGDSQ